MLTAAKRAKEELWEELVQNLTFDLFEDEEVEEVSRDIRAFDQRYRLKALALCVSLSKSASGLVPNLIRRINTASKSLSPKEMELWITHAFDLLEAQGMDAFFRFLSRIDEEELNKFKRQDGLSLQAVSVILETYLSGISGMHLRIVPDDQSYTDTESIFLPYHVNEFKERENNFVIYKLMAVYQWARIARGTLTPDPVLLRNVTGEDRMVHPDIADLFHMFAHRALAVDLYAVIDAFRLERHLQHELSGLMRDAQVVKKCFFEKRPSLCAISEKQAAVEALYQVFLTGDTKGGSPRFIQEALPLIDGIRRAGETPETLDVLHALYSLAEGLKGEYHGTDMGYLGSIHPEKVSAHLKEKTAQKKKRLESVISKLVNMPHAEVHPFPHEISQKSTPVQRLPKKDAKYLLVKGRLFEVDQETEDIIQEVSILSDGMLLDGTSSLDAKVIFSLKDFIEEEEEGGEEGGIRYDEWDFRRNDYKKGWCSLFEKEINPGDEPFVDLTLKRYGGYVRTLRRKFELLKKELNIMRRQKEGDDIDIDAIVEAFADARAGLSPSQNLFTKLDRQERSIGALFLLDMSGSTKGWVNRAEKEALVLMCEALEALGDRYAICGFSGITRNMCEFYKVKGFDEDYDMSVKRRIAGIVPKDYTRMGPPIRHATQILKTVDVKTKLLVTLSDGHPEDRDSYRGDYGVEDTRKALIEAKEQGIQPFCITIDKEARSYLPHMFGEVSYIVLDDVRKLPNRITEIYRTLTT